MNVKLGKAAFCLLGMLFFAESAVVSAQTISSRAYLEHKAIVPVPAGNRNEQMPALAPGAVKRRTRSVNPRSFDSSFITSLNSINDAASREIIFTAAQKYGVDPIYIAAAIVGEGTFNVTVFDKAQNYSMKAMTWAPKWALKFSNNAVNLADVVRSTEMAPCQLLASDYERWECIRATWETKFRGKTFNGVQLPNSRFREAFFDPIGTGFTYGPGQLEPLRALMFSDIVSQTSGAPALSVDDAQGIYTAIIDPRLSFHYMAASIRKTIEVYKSVAGFDISTNPGVIATLYNLGFELQHAKELFNKNTKELTRGAGLIYPQENFYGWAINARIDDLYLWRENKWRGQTTSAISLDAEADAAIARSGGVLAEQSNGEIGSATSSGNFFFNLLNPNRR